MIIKYCFLQCSLRCFLNAIAVLYDYPGGGILSSCFRTCSLYRKSVFFNVILQNHDRLLFFSNKSGAMMSFWSLFFPLFFVFFLKEFPVVGLVKLSIVDVKQNIFKK